MFLSDTPVDKAELIDDTLLSNTVEFHYFVKNGEI